MNGWNDWKDLTDDADVENNGAAIPDAPFPDPWDDDHNIEYWVWDGERLVPATPDEQANIQEMEHIASARRRMAQWTHSQSQRRASPRARVLAGVRQTIASFWRLWRHGAHPMAPSPETRHTTASAHHQDSEG